MISRAALDRIKEVIDPADILIYFGGVSPKDITESNTEVRCPCPLHGGNNSSGFIWKKQTNTWFCFTNNCGRGQTRDVFSFLQIKQGLSFYESVNRLADYYGIDISQEEDPVQTKTISIATKSIKQSSDLTTLEYKTLEELPYYDEGGFIILRSTSTFVVIILNR